MAGGGALDPAGRTGMPRIVEVQHASRPTKPTRAAAFQRASVLLLNQRSGKRLLTK